MKHFFWLLAVAVFVQVTAVSCNKDDDDEGTRTERIQNKNWKLTALTSDKTIDFLGNGNGGTDVYAQLPDCFKDDLTIFKANNVVTYDEGATKCDPTDPQSTNSTWSFNTDETILTDGGDSYLIKEFSNKKIVAESNYEANGVTYKFTFTFQN